MRVPPSGRQVELVHGDQRATVVEIGGGLREYSVGGWPVLAGYDVAEPCSWGRGQVLVPWPNRIRDGQYHLDGRSYQLSLSEPERSNAVHGLTRWSAWQLDQPGPDQVVATFLLHPRPGYPFMLECRVAYRLGPGGLAVDMSVTNRCDDPAPVGMGAHPYLSAGEHGVDRMALQVPAASRLLVDERRIPTGCEPVSGEYDYREQRLIGSGSLDTAYTDLIRDADGLARVRMAVPDRPEVAVWVDSTWPYLQLFTGDAMPAADRRRSLAVEPMTCAPDAFNSGDGLRVLAPDQTLAGTWGITTAAS
jgi:aldose 1-epimerase